MWFKNSGVRITAVTEAGGTVKVCELISVLTHWNLVIANVSLVIVETTAIGLDEGSRESPFFAPTGVPVMEKDASRGCFARCVSRQPGQRARSADRCPGPYSGW